MYSPAHFVETRTEVLMALMQAHRLATLVHRHPHDAALFDADHIPLLATRRGDDVVLTGHVARANPLWQHANGQSILAVFQGPEAYITPSWYASKAAHGKVVPTWNYAVVHAHGVLTAHEDAAWLLAHVTANTDANEAGRTNPWRVSDAPPDYVQKLTEAIVGIEIVVTRLEGKWKVSQNRPAADREGVAAGLTHDPQPDARAMAALVRNTAR